MTFPDSMDSVMETEDRLHTDIGAVLSDALVLALKEERLTYGVYASAKLLDSNPDSVSMCVLPKVDQEEDLSLQIQHKLIQAYCWENGISIFKVNNMSHLCLILGGHQESVNNNTVTGKIDCSCIVIESKALLSKVEVYATEFYQDLLTKQETNILSSKIIPTANQRYDTVMSTATWRSLRTFARWIESAIQTGCRMAT